jgi:hypothetical protein
VTRHRKEKHRRAMEVTWRELTESEKESKRIFLEKVTFGY